MATKPTTHLTPEQYLEIERNAEFKSEYYQGEMFAMAGAREAHNLIAFNLATELGVQLRKRPCRAYVSDMRVLVNSTGLYTYPDLTGVCAEPQFLDDTRDTLLNPVLIVEVLSPSTERYDRGRKFEHYRSVESVAEYLLISSDRINAELYTRQHDGTWNLRAVNKLEDALQLESVGVRLTLSDLYDKVDFAGGRRLDDRLGQVRLVGAARIFRQVVAGQRVGARAGPAADLLVFADAALAFALRGVAQRLKSSLLR